MAITATPTNGNVTHREGIRAQGQIYGQTLAVAGAAELGSLNVDGPAVFEAGITEDGQARTGSMVFVERRKFLVATSGVAGTLTGTVNLPAGAIIVDIIIHCVALFNSGTSATLKVGDAADDDGFFTGVDCKATDLLAGESISFFATGGKEGADVTAPGAATHIRRRYLGTARVIKGILTLVGTTATTGEIYMDVIYSLPSATYNVAAAYAA